MGKFSYKKMAERLKKDGFLITTTDLALDPPYLLFKEPYKIMEQYSFNDHRNNVELGYHLRVFDDVKDNKIFFHYPVNTFEYGRERTYLDDFLNKSVHQYAVSEIKYYGEQLTTIGNEIVKYLVPACDYEPWERGLNILRFLYYPGASDMAKAHTDRDGLTIITNSQPGLEIKINDIWAKVVPKSTVLLLGDKLAKELGVKACEHRVVGKQKDRYSTVFFYDRLYQFPGVYNIVGGKL